MLLTVSVIIALILVASYAYVNHWQKGKRIKSIKIEEEENPFPGPVQKYIFWHPSGKVVTEIPITPTEEGIYFAVKAAKDIMDSHPFYYISLVPYKCQDYRGIEKGKWSDLDKNCSCSIIIEKDDKN